MVSLYRTFNNLKRGGWKQFYRNLWYVGDAKFGKHVGTDQFGNRFFENVEYGEEVPGRHRWVDFSQHDFNASQIPPEWHSWIHHIRKDPPPQDPILAASRPSWQAPFVESLTGTRGKYTPYSTVAPKVTSWEPTVAQRGGSSTKA